MGVLTQLLQQTLLQPTVGLLLLWNRREGLRNTQNLNSQWKQRDSKGSSMTKGPDQNPADFLHLEGGDVEILPERQAQNVQVLPAVAERTGQSDEDCRERGVSLKLERAHQNQGSGF